MVISILQSNYIPWKGYFDLIDQSDIFVIYDEVQYTKNDWRNRNIIKTQKGTEWLTIAVKQNSLDQKINETEALKYNWYKKHMNSLQASYGKSKYFKEYKELFFEIYEKKEMNLSAINKMFITAICKVLGIETKIINSKELNLVGDKQERLIDACKKLKADTYLSGPAAKSYLEEEKFNGEGIKVKWMDYSGYSEYSQLYPPFSHQVTILDLIFNEGPNAKSFLKKNAK